MKNYCWRFNYYRIIIILGLILLIGLSGCSRNISSDIINSSPEIINTEIIPTIPAVDPEKAAESEVCFEQGLKLYEEYKYQEAVVAFDKAIAANPDNYKVYSAKGIAICFQGKYQQGIEQIQKTLDLKPDYTPAFYDMAMACKLQKNYDQSLFWFDKTIKGDPQNTWSYYGIATIYADQGNTADSLRYLENAIKLDPGVKAAANRQSHFDRMRTMPEFKALVQ